MNTSNLQFGTLRGYVLVTCACALTMASAAADEGRKFQTVLHESNVYGSDDVAEGRYEKGIERLSTRARSETTAHSLRVPALIDLCVAYTMTQQLEKAEETCNKAVDSGWYSGYAYNNRGAYNISIGNYEAAIRDFEAAIEGRGADRIARQNLELAQQRLLAMQEEIDKVHVVAQSTDTDTVEAE